MFLPQVTLNLIGLIFAFIFGSVHKYCQCFYVVNTEKMLQRSKMFYFCCRFGLFEAMSAIEMMDPKMDAGMIGNQVNRKVLNFEQAIKVLISFSWNENSIQTEM